MEGSESVAASWPEGHKPLSSSRKSVKKRDAILRAAVEIINAKSYAEATMTEIAARLDLRDAALYYYFPNKQALVFACHLRSLERFEQFLIEANQAGGTGAARLRRFLEDLLVDSGRNGPLLYFGDYSYLDDMQRATIAGWGERLTAMLERLLIEGIEDGSIVPCETAVVVQLMLGMLIWLAKWVRSDMSPSRLMAAIDVIAMNGLARCPAACA
ncbi:MAG: TetR family transcriptional regulator [Caulobacter sp.]|nr:TetR family transcriptional regulator [Caulobacter sp.]